MEAMTVYRASIRSGDLEVITRELHRFSLWCGPERELTALSPALISEYAEQVGGTGTAPQAASRLQALRGFLSYARKKRMVPENLAQHVRIPKRKAGARIRSDDGDGSDRVELTPEGHARLTNQLGDLQAERSPLATQIRRAAADKDVRENAPLEAAREQLGLVESRIRGIEASLRAAVVIEPDASASDTVRIGSVVSLKDLETGRQAVYTLVDRTEANPLGRQDLRCLPHRQDGGKKEPGRRDRGRDAAREDAVPDYQSLGLNADLHRASSAHELPLV